MPLVNSRSASSRGFKCELVFTKITFHVVNTLLNWSIYISMLFLITVNFAGRERLPNWIRFKQLRAASAFWLMFHYIKWSLICNLQWSGKVPRTFSTPVPDIKNSRHRITIICQDDFVSKMFDWFDKQDGPVRSYEEKKVLNPSLETRKFEWS
jgi:hypothetical protein